MEEHKKFIKENLVHFSVAGYGLGLLYMSIYYYFFNLPIIYYLTLNDMLFFSVTLILPIIIVVFLVEYVIIKPLKSSFYRRELQLPTEAKYNFWWTIVISAIVVICIFIEQIRINPNLFFCIIFSGFTLIAKLEYNLKRKTLGFVSLLIAIGLSFSLYFSITYGLAGFANKDVQFKYENKLISTSFHNDLNYLGETSSTIFLYNFKKKLTYPYNKENITSLTYTDKIIKEYAPVKDIDLYSKNTAQIKVASDTVFKPYIWYTYNKKIYYWTAEKNTIGLSRAIYEIKYILENNNFDFEEPTHGHSSLPQKMNMEDDLKLASDAINSGNSEVHKKWEKSSGKIELRLTSKFYLIQVNFEKNIN